MYLNHNNPYSRYGTISTEKLLKTGVEKSISTLGLTNINSTGNEQKSIKSSGHQRIATVAGVEVCNADQFLYVLIPRNYKGLAQIQSFLSEHLDGGKPFPEATARPGFFDNINDGFVIYPMCSKSLSKLLPNEKIGMLPWEVNKLKPLGWKNYKDKFIVRPPLTSQYKTYFNLYTLLDSISTHCLLSKLSVDAEASEKETFVSSSMRLKAYEQYSSIITNTYRLMNACSISTDFKL